MLIGVVPPPVVRRRRVRVNAVPRGDLIERCALPPLRFQKFSAAPSSDDRSMASNALRSCGGQLGFALGFLQQQVVGDEQLATTEAMGIGGAVCCR